MLCLGVKQSVLGRMLPIFLVLGAIFARQDAAATAALKIDGGGSIQKGKSLTLKVKERSGATGIRWYQIIQRIT